MLSVSTSAPAAPPPGGAVRRRALAVALAVLGAGLACVAPGAAATAPPALTSTVVVSGSATAYTEVALTRPLIIPATAAPAVRVSNARATMLALVRVQSGKWPPGLVLTRLAGTQTWHYHWTGHASGTDADDDPPTLFTKTLPAGRYRLYLATSGATAVTWTLPLPRGRTAVAPRSRTTWVATASTSPGVRGTAVAPAYSEELTAAVVHRGLVTNLLWYDAYADVEASFGGCMYPGQPSALGLGTLPACLDRNASNGPLGPATDDRLVSQGTLYVEPGTWTNKAYVRVTGAVRDGGISVGILDLGAGFPAR